MSRALHAIALAAVLVAARAAAGPTGEQLAAAAGQPLIGRPAPRLVLHALDGSRIDLASLYGRKAVYLKFWATWCVPCREQMPHFERIYERAGDGLAVLAVNAGFTDTVADVEAVRREFSLRMPIVIDDGLAGEAFHLRVTPTHVVIGRDGRIAYIGHLADDRLEAALVAAQAPVAAILPPTPPARVAARAAPKVPATPLPTLDGPDVDLGSTPDRMVVVFLSPWCETYLAHSRPTVARQCRELRERAAALSGEAGVRTIGIASGLWATAGDLREYRDRHEIRMPLVLDESGALFRAFGIRSVPAAVVIDGGRLRRSVPVASLASDARFRAEVLAP